MRPQRSFLTLTFVLAMLSAASAPAQTQVSGFELERLELDPSALGALTMGTARLLEPGTFRVAAALSYANSPLIAVRNELAIGAVVRDRLTLQVTAALAVHHRIELGAAIPVVLMQLGDDLTSYGIAAPAVAGLGNPWVLARTNILEDGELVPFDLGAQLGVAIPVGSVDALASSKAFVLAPKVLATKELGPVLASGELGLDLRPLVNLGVEEYGPQLTFGAAVLTQEALHPALRGLRPEASVRMRVPFTGQVPSAELLLGGRMPVGPGWNAFLLLGAGFGKTPGTPRFLVSVGASLDNANGMPKPSRRLTKPPAKTEPAKTEAPKPGTGAAAEDHPQDPKPPAVP